MRWQGYSSSLFAESPAILRRLNERFPIFPALPNRKSSGEYILLIPALLFLAPTWLSSFLDARFLAGDGIDSLVNYGSL